MKKENCDRHRRTLERRGYQHITLSKILSILLPKMDEKGSSKAKQETCSKTADCKNIKQD